jgi:ribose 5-phosphate isomerase B
MRMDMKTIANKQILVAADLAGVPLKEAVVGHLQRKGWEVTDIGVKSEDEANPEMFHRIGLRVGAKIAEGEFERALVFCGTGMGIHVAASKCPHVHAAVVESAPSGLRSVTGNNCNVLAMGAFYVAPQTGMDIADAYLENNLGDGYENWDGFYEFHKFAYDELESFDYQAFKENGFEFKDPVPGSAELGPEPLVKGIVKGE